MNVSNFLFNIVIMCLITLIYMYAVGYLRHWSDLQIFVGKPWEEIQEARKILEEKIKLEKGEVGASISPTIMQQLSSLLPYSNPCSRYGDAHRNVSRACIDKMWYDAGCTSKSFPYDSFKFAPKSFIQQAILNLASSKDDKSYEECHGSNYKEVMERDKIMEANNRLSEDIRLRRLKENIAQVEKEKQTSEEAKKIYRENQSSIIPLMRSPNVLGQPATTTPSRVITTSAPIIASVPAMASTVPAIALSVPSNIASLSPEMTISSPEMPLPNMEIVAPPRVSTAATKTLGEYIGCFKDDATRVFKKLLKSGSSTKWSSPNECHVAASAEKSGYYGLQNVQNGKGECWYSPGENDIDYNKLGEASNCTFHNGDMYGGGWSNAVYKTPYATKSPAMEMEESIQTLALVPVIQTRIPLEPTSAIGEYIGCFRDDATRVFKKLLKSGSSTKWSTPGECYAVANAENSGYYGLQNVQNGKGECWYSPGENDIDYNKLGEASNCTFHNGDMYGGGWSNAVYKTPSAIGKYIGCFKDDATRVFKTAIKDGDTIKHVPHSVCYNTAKNAGSSFYGLQFAKNGMGQCWYSPGEMDIDYKKLGEANNCVLQGNDMYGGEWSNAVYKTL